MKKTNCWEVRECGRQLGGDNVATAGVCPAASPGEYDGVNGGLYAGRFCWAVAGALSEDQQQCTNRKGSDCSQCEFFQQIVKESGFDFALTVKDAKKQQSIEA